MFLLQMRAHGGDVSGENAQPARRASPNAPDSTRTRGGHCGAPCGKAWTGRAARARGAACVLDKRLTEAARLTHASSQNRVGPMPRRARRPEQQKATGPCAADRRRPGVGGVWGGGRAVKSVCWKARCSRSSSACLPWCRCRHSPRRRRASPTWPRLACVRPSCSFLPRGATNLGAGGGAAPPQIGRPHQKGAEMSKGPEWSANALGRYGHRTTHIRSSSWNSSQIEQLHHVPTQAAGSGAPGSSPDRSNVRRRRYLARAPCRGEGNCGRGCATGRRHGRAPGPRQGSPGRGAPWYVCGVDGGSLDCCIGRM